MGDTIIEVCIMSNNEIYNSSIESSKKELDNNKNLSKRDREKFADEFKSINSLIEEYLDIDEETPPTTTENSIEDTSKPETNKESFNPLEMKHSYNNQMKAHEEKLRRIGILKSDPTGKDFKASGEDI